MVFIDIFTHICLASLKKGSQSNSSLWLRVFYHKRIGNSTRDSTLLFSYSRYLMIVFKLYHAMVLYMLTPYLYICYGIYDYSIVNLVNFDKFTKRILISSKFYSIPQTRIVEINIFTKWNFKNHGLKKSTMLP